MARQYSVDLPYRVPNYQLSGLITLLIGHDVWRHLPHDAAVKINKAVMDRTDLVITRADLDSLPDSVWDIVGPLVSR